MRDTKDMHGRGGANRVRNTVDMTRKGGAVQACVEFCGQTRMNTVHRNIIQPFSLSLLFYSFG